MLEWDTAFWGFPIARYAGGFPPDAEIAAVDAWCERHAIQCLYVLADADDADAPESLASRAYSLMDERVTLVWSAASQSPVLRSQPPAGLVIRPSVPADIPALRAIASESHTDTRFFADQRFPREKAHELYAHWITNSCAGFADVVLVAALHGTPVGYCSCHCPPDPTAKGSIGLLAVAQAARGLGVGRVLVQRALDWFVEQGLGQVMVVTQGRNSVALRLYQTCGFTIEHRQHWYHRWFAERIDQG